MKNLDLQYNMESLDVRIAMGTKSTKLGVWARRVYPEIIIKFFLTFENVKYSPWLYWI